jgi:hypothetical protein
MREGNMEKTKEPQTGYDDEKTRDIARLCEIGIKTIFAVNKILLEAEDMFRKDEGDDEQSKSRD